MILRLLNTRSPLIAILLIILNFVLILKISIIHVPASETYLLGHLLDNYLDFSSSQWDTLSFSFVFSSILAMMLNLLNQRFNLIKSANSLLSFVFLFLLLQNYGIFFHPSVILAQLFIVIAFFKLFGLVKSDNDIAIFQIGLLSSIAFILYIDMALFVLIFPILIFVIKRNFNFRQVGLFIIGFLVIIELFWASYFLITSDYMQPLLELKHYFSRINPIFLRSGYRLWASGFILFIFLLALWSYSRQVNRLSISVRLFFKILFFYFNLLLLAYFSLVFTSDYLWISLAFSLSFLFTKFFLNLKNTIFAEIIFLLFIVSQLFYLWI